MASTLSKAGGTGTYTFASQPRAVAPQRSSKYREPQQAQAVAQEDLSKSSTYGNMMFDPRVVRGNTYRLQQTSSATIPDPLELQRQQEAFRRTQAKKRAEERSRVRTPDAVAGRQNTEVQTELYLEELTDRVEESHVDTQTDAFLDRPPSPAFIPVKSGIDAWTQILNGELFDFDREVRPLLEVLVGKTLEQALMEVMEEEELARLRQHQTEFDELRNAELVETQRREEAARRAREEKDRRVRQAREAAAKEKETADKVAARAFAKNYIASIVPGVFDSLSRAGYFYDQQEREIEMDFLPWLLSTVEDRLVKQQRARALLDALIQTVVSNRAAAFQQFDPASAPAPAAAPSLVISSDLAPEEPAAAAAAPAPVPSVSADEPAPSDAPVADPAPAEPEAAAAAAAAAPTEGEEEPAPPPASDDAPAADSADPAVAEAPAEPAAAAAATSDDAAPAAAAEPDAAAQPPPEDAAPAVPAE